LGLPDVRDLNAAWSAWSRERSAAPEPVQWVTSLPSLSASRTDDHSDVGREALADASVSWQWACLHAQLDEQTGAITRLQRHRSALVRGWSVLKGVTLQGIMALCAVLLPLSAHCDSGSSLLTKILGFGLNINEVATKVADLPETYRDVSVRGLDFQSRRWPSCCGVRSRENQHLGLAPQSY
jgi:hypothetical protein